MSRLLFALSFFSLTCLVAYIPAIAQEHTATVQDKIPQEVFNTDADNFLTLTFENDSLGGGTDQDYTNGIRLTYLDVSDRPQAFAQWLDKLVPLFAINETTSMSWSLGQNLYTPDDISISAPQPGKRPWAAFLYGSIGLSSLSDNHIDDLEATLGIVGPWAQGEAVQKFVHGIMDVTEPEGWDNQISNEPGVMLSWRRRWPQFFDRSAHDLFFALEPNVGATLGNVYTLAEAGITARLSPTHSRWQDTPIQVRPAIPGSGFFQSQGNHLDWYLFAGLQGRAVARNIFLDGNTFRDSASVDKNPFVLDANAGIAFTYGDTRISYTAVYRTKEFDGQNDASLFGSVNIGYRF